MNREKVRTLMRAREMSESDVARHARIMPETLAAILKGEVEPTFAQLFDIGQAVGVYPYQISGQTESSAVPRTWEPVAVSGPPWAGTPIHWRTHYDGCWHRRSK
jgi:transcriptional regulator with XRE-family HTH domain